MREVIFILIIIFALTSCRKEENAIPSYIIIDDIELNDNTSENITDAWFYVNDNLIGVYELPANFPVLEKGIKNIRVKAGIKVNGISATRSPYPFYTSFVDSINFTEDTSQTIISIIVEYLPEIDWNKVFIEDFIGGNQGIQFLPSGINTSILQDTIIMENGEVRTCGYITLDDSLTSFEVSTLELTELPQQSADIFLEMDYKCDHSFIIGVYVNYSTSINQKYQLMEIFPKSEFKKIYIDLKTIVSSGINASSFQIFIGFQKPEEIQKTTLYIDNFRVIYI